MKKTLPLFITALFFIQYSSIAQVQIGIMGGPQFSIRYHTKSIADNHFITSANAGITSIIPLSRKFNLHGTFGYSGKGVILKDYVYSDGAGGTVAGDINILLHYLELRSPINYSIDLSSKFNLLIGTGPYLAYAVGGRQKFKGSDYFASFLTRDLYFGDEYKRFEFGVTSNMILQVRRKWLLGMYTDIGLTDTYGPETSRNISHRSVSFTLGYLFVVREKKLINHKW